MLPSSRRETTVIEVSLASSITSEAQCYGNRIDGSVGGVWCSCSVAEVGDTVVGVDKVGQEKHDQEKKKQA